MTPTLIGLDHAVIAVRDLDRAAAEWAALGFRLSPRGTHSPHMGTGNHTMMFGEDYIELMGVLTDQPHNAGLRGFVAGREGLERCAFTTTDAAAGVAALRARHIAADGPVEFGRPVTLPDGGLAEARFSVMQWPPDEAPGNLRIFACQHHTPDAVWVPELQRQPNGVTRIISALIATPDPAGAAAQMARLIDGEVLQEGAFHRVATGPGRAEFGFAPRADIAHIAGLDAGLLPERGGAALVLGTTIPRPTAVATGCALIFRETML